MQRNVGRRLCMSGYSMELRLQSWSSPQELCDVCTSLPRQQRGSPRNVAHRSDRLHAISICCRRVSPSFLVYVGGLHVNLRAVSVALQWATKSPRTGRKFRVEDSLRDPAVRHSMHMANPAKLCLKNESLYAGDAATV